jgi:hypothetical protein
MPITIELTGTPLADVALTTVDLMREVGLLARERILRRTAQGQGVAGPFAAYSPGYAKKKAETLGGSGVVNLQVSGQMLNAIQLVEVTDHSVTLGFTS